MTIGTIGKAVRFSDGKLFTAEALPNAGNKLSSAFQLGKLANAAELVVELDAAIEVPATKNLKIEIHGSATYDGSFTKFDEIFAAAGAAEAATAVAAGEIVRYAPPSTFPAYAKLKVITDFDGSAKTFTAATEYRGR